MSAAFRFGQPCVASAWKRGEGLGPAACHPPPVSQLHRGRAPRLGAADGYTHAPLRHGTAQPRTAEAWEEEGKGKTRCLASGSPAHTPRIAAADALLPSSPSARAESDRQDHGYAHYAVID
ncbi:hypothetical protein CDD83_6454 [Cordyceps sp. RAO-2017]|nr:hypothetical protein CDD83_6454 [Cordyceps sp. RAO-2017]